MKTDDYLARRSFRPGEFERLQAAFEAQVAWLTAQLDGPMSQSQAAQDVEQALADFARWFPGEPLPDERTVRAAMVEAAHESCGLLARQALSCWYWHEQESPQLSLAERARVAGVEAMRQEGWSGGLAVHEALVGALAQGVPAHLR